jgi:hypothetical protein
MRRSWYVVAVLALFGALLGAPGSAAAEAGAQRWVTTMGESQDMCIGVAGGKMVNGAKVILWQCSGAADQSWLPIPTNPYDPGYYQIQNWKNPSKCLSVPNNSTARGVQLIIWDCQYASGQLWDARYLNENWVNLKNLGSGLMVANAGGRTTNGTPIIQWTANDCCDQIWIHRDA